MQFLGRGGNRQKSDQKQAEQTNSMIRQRNIGLQPANDSRKNRGSFIRKLSKLKSDKLWHELCASEQILTSNF